MILKKIAKVIFYKLPLRLRCKVLSTLLGGVMRIGQGSYIHPSVHLLKKSNIRVGSNTCISEGCWLNVNHQVENKISIKIGSNCFIGKGNFFSSGDVISIGDYTLTTFNCKFIGSTHIIENPLIPYIASGTTANCKITIGVNCFIGAGATVLGNVHIGHGSVIGAESLVMNDVASFSIAYGNPAKIIKRYSFKSKKWINLSEFTREDEASLPSEDEYLTMLAFSFPVVKMPWIAAGKSMGDL